MTTEKKTRYGMWSNTCYMLDMARRKCPSVPVFVCALAVLDIIMNLLGLFVVPVILGTVETQAPLRKLVGIILFFALGMLVTGALTAYIKCNQCHGKITVRVNIIMDIMDKTNRTSFPNTLKQDFLNMEEKAMQASRSNADAAEAIWETLMGLLKSIFGLLLYLFFLSRINIWVLVLTAAITLAGYEVTRKADAWAHRREKEKTTLFHKLGYINNRAQNLACAKDIRIYGMKEWLLGLYNRFIGQLAGFYARRAKVYLGKDVAVALMDFLKGGAAYFYLIHLALQGSIGAAEFLFYFSAISGFTAWVTDILSGMSHLYKQSLYISDIREFIEYEEPFLFEEGEKLEPIKENQYEIELEHVSFRYPSAEKDTLHDVCLTVHQGEKLAVVGLNGAGKTTLVKLICGFLEPTEGRVLLNGEDIKKYNRRDYYRHFSAVFQDFSILPGSIALNVSQADDDIDMEKVKNCIEKAGLKEMTESLPGKYDAYLEKRVYEEAVDLSGGEMQRLMLARALYKEAPVIILDEPTAALDPLAESDMYRRYHELTGGCTSVYISHRLASTRFCDRIILLENGEIREEGGHESLLAAGGEYARLYEVQSRYYREKSVEGGVCGEKR